MGFSYRSLSKSISSLFLYCPCCFWFAMASASPFDPCTYCYPAGRRGLNYTALGPPQRAPLWSEHNHVHDAIQGHFLHKASLTGSCSTEIIVGYQSPPLTAEMYWPSTLRMCLQLVCSEGEKLTSASFPSCLCKAKARKLTSHHANYTQLPRVTGAVTSCC